MTPGTTDATLLQGVADHLHLLGVTAGLVVVVQSRQRVADGTTVGVLLVASRTGLTHPRRRVDVIVVEIENTAKGVEVVVWIAGGDGVQLGGTSIVGMAIALVGGSKK